MYLGLARLESWVALYRWVGFTVRGAEPGKGLPGI